MSRDIYNTSGKAARGLECTLCGISGPKAPGGVLQYGAQGLIQRASGAAICHECVDEIAAALAENMPSSVSRTRSALFSNWALKTNLATFGIKPRFESYSFVQKHNEAFYIGPFNSPFSEVYSRQIKPTLRARKYRSVRGDEVYGATPIVESVWRAINSSKFVIAEMTGRNPNVLYEVGLAHAVGKPIIFITQDIEDIPFDLRHHRIILYSLDTAAINKFGRQLVKAIDAVTKEDLVRLPKPSREQDAED